jgi:hypothetical protein
MLPLAVLAAAALEGSRLDSVPQRSVLMSNTDSRLRSAVRSWYRVHFSKAADLSAIRASGIDLQPRFYVGRRRYNLFLTSSENLVL